MSQIKFTKELSVELLARTMAVCCFSDAEENCGASLLNSGRQRIKML